MAYQTGTATSPDDLLDKLRLWLIDCGWTVNKWDTDNTYYGTLYSGMVGTGKRLHVQKTATTGDVMYFNFRSVNRGVVFGVNALWYLPMANGRYRGELTGIGMYGSTGFNDGLAWDKQPGNLETTNGNLSYGVTVDDLSLSSIPAYHFFQNGDCYAVVIEYTSGKYQQFVFGTLKKQGAFTGGQFFSGSIDSYDPAGDSYYKSVSTPIARTLGMAFSYYSNGAVYLEVDSESRWRSSGGRGDSGIDPLNIYFNKTHPYNDSGLGQGSPWCYDQMFMTRSPNAYNALAAMCPIIVEAKRSSGNYSVIGSPEGVRSLNITHYSNAQEITFGSETWMVFPCHDKTGDPVQNIGMAFKKA